MKIEGNKINAIVGQYKKIESNTKKKERVNYGKEKIEISSKSKEIEKLAKKIKLMPRVRTEVVQRIRKEIENGNYPVNVDKVASAIVRDLAL
jgi:negative regulator of flagellin synthesis FlgM